MTNWDVGAMGDLLNDLAENLLDDQHGIKGSSLDLLRELHLSIRKDMPDGKKRRWNKLMKDVKGVDARYYVDETP